MEKRSNIIIIGAGVGGLTFAIALKRQFGHTNFTIYEKASEVGGTWRANTYPGCSSDVPVHWYSLSSDLNPSWEKTHALRPEIQTYWVELAKKYDLYAHIVFNSVVVSANWDASGEAYDIVVQNVFSGKRSLTRANVLVSATGVLERPKIPYEIPGLSNFEGPWFHSALWRSDVDLYGKRVAVVGNASSAVQFIPIISEDSATTVVNFVRTPVWFNTRPHIPYSDLEKWAFGNLPLVMRLHRFGIMWEFDAPLLIPQSTRSRRERIKNMEQYIRQHAPVQYHDKLIPTHPPGCKRTVADSGYLASLHRPNVLLNFNGVSRVEADRIVTNAGESILCDVIIYATGFIGDGFPVDVRGVDGQSLRAYYEAHGGPTAYLGTVVPTFPNFFMLAGPNSGTHASTLFVEEVQTAYCLQLIKPIIDGTISSVSVKSSATDHYNSQLERKFSTSVLTQCTSWQRINGSGKVFVQFPGAVTLYWWYLCHPNWDHFQVRRPGDPTAKRFPIVSLSRILKSGIFVLMLLGGMRQFQWSRITLKSLMTKTLDFLSPSLK